METFGSSRAYLTSILFPYRVFADEIDKYQYLKTLKGTLEPLDCTGISFALLDDQFTIATFSQRPGNDPGPQLLTSFQEKYLPMYIKRHPDCPAFFVNAGSTPIEEKSMLLQSALGVHFIPRDKGLVRHVEDYWWSSYQSYHGTYSWDFLDTTILLSMMGRRSRARRELYLYTKRLYEAQHQSAGDEL